MGYDESTLITKKTLWEQIADVLREDIIRGKIKQGERIVEEEIAMRFHVSRGPGRERIASKGYSTISDRQPCIRVSPL